MWFFLKFDSYIYCLFEYVHHKRVNIRELQVGAQPLCGGCGWRVSRVSGAAAVAIGGGSAAAAARGSSGAAVGAQLRHGLVRVFRERTFVSANLGRERLSAAATSAQARTGEDTVFLLLLGDQGGDSIAN